MGLLAFILAGFFAAVALLGWWAAFRAQRKASLLEGKAEALLAEIDRISTDIEEYKQREQAHLDAEKRASALEQQVKHLGEREAERAASLQVMQVQFENLAHQIFTKKQQEFQLQSQKGLSDILTPLKERFVEFEKKVNETYGQHAKEQHHLKHEIARIIEVNQAMKLQTESLTRALKGDVKMQGNWGEIILEKVLETSGLRRGDHYTLQGEGMKLKHVEFGSHMKPDVIVHLPDEKHLIIDSKVSLTHYERYIAETDEPARALHLKQFVASVRAHASGLEAKRYQDVDGLNTPDFVLMFMPIESAYALAIQSDPELHSFAWDKRIYFVSPSTLFPILHTVSSLWRMDMQNKNALEIARQSGNLYDKVVGFVDEFRKVGERVSQAQKSYDTALGRLSEGKDNILTKAQRIKELGAKTSKQLPAQLLEEAADEIQADLPEKESA